MIRNSIIWAEAANCFEAFAFKCGDGDVSPRSHFRTPIIQLELKTAVFGCILAYLREQVILRIDITSQLIEFKLQFIGGTLEII